MRIVWSQRVRLCEALGVLALLSCRPAIAQGYTMTDLGTLGPLGTVSAAAGINDRGQVAGYAGADLIFLWENGVMQDLNSLLPPHSGWELFHATGINTSGQIVGSGNHYATLHAFLMTPRAAAARN